MNRIIYIIAIIIVGIFALSLFKTPAGDTGTAIDQKLLDVETSYTELYNNI